jgi:hypothetical protein
MKPPNRHPDPSDPVDDFLRPRIRQAPATLEARFAVLKANLPEQSPARAGRLRRFPPQAGRLWISAGTLAATLVLGMLLFRGISERDQPGHAHVNATAADVDAVSPYFLTEDPFELEAALAPALVLLDPETVEALIYLPYEKNS